MNILIIVIILNSIAILLCLRGILINIYINNKDVIIYLILLSMNGLVMILNIVRLIENI